MGMLRCWEEYSFPSRSAGSYKHFQSFSIISVDVAVFFKSRNYFLFAEIHSLELLQSFVFPAFSHCFCLKFFIIAIVVSVAFFFNVKHCVV